MEKLKIQEINASDGSIIKLNVGGQYFTTSKTTLLADKNSMLGIMFSGYHEVTKSSEDLILLMPMRLIFTSF